jgi:hypothetical protein
MEQKQTTDERLVKRAFGYAGAGRGAEPDPSQGPGHPTRAQQARLKQGSPKRNGQWASATGRAGCFARGWRGQNAETNHCGGSANATAK